MILDSPQNHGWDEICNFKWSEEVYPEAVVSFLGASITCADEEDNFDLEEDDVNDIFDVDENLDGEDYF